MPQKKKVDAFPHIEPKVHRRVLEFINAAKRPGDLAELPANEAPVIADPEHRDRKPDLRKRKEPACGPGFLDAATAETLIRARDVLPARLALRLMIGGSLNMSG